MSTVVKEIRVVNINGALGRFSIKIILNDEEFKQASMMVDEGLLRKLEIQDLVDLESVLGEVLGAYRARGLS